MRLACGLLLLAAVLAPAQVQLPRYTRQVLPNGIVLDVMPRSDVPLVTVRVLVRGGIESEPPELSGIAAVTAEALRRGTAKRNSAQLSAEIDSLGAVLFTGADMQSVSVSLELLAKDLDAGLDILRDALVNPAFPADEMKKLVAQRVDSAKSAKDNPAYAGAEYYRSLFFGEQHPYGRPADEVTLGKITRDDIAAYHKRMFVGRNIIIAIAGDVDATEASAKASAAFSSIPGGQAYAWQTATIPGRSGNRVAVVDKPGATQTNFFIGVPGIDRTNPDRIPLWLVNTLFGGRFTSILNDELRVNSGLTYGAGSRFDQDHLRGRITISSFTKTETTGEAVNKAVSLLKRIAEQGITADQLASAKAYLQGTYPPDHLETASQLADVVAEIELYDLTRAEVNDLFSRMDAVTVEQANAVARKYYGSGNLTILLLGNAAKIAPEVRKYDPQPQQISITRPGLRIPQ